MKWLILKLFGGVFVLFCFVFPKKGFSGDSADKEFACNVGDLGSFLDWEDPLEKGMATTPVFWPGQFHGLYSPWGCKE